MMYVKYTEDGEKEDPTWGVAVKPGAYIDHGSRNRMNDWLVLWSDGNSGSFDARFLKFYGEVDEPGTPTS